MRVPGYRVKRTIGRGGMATVFLAVQESLDREVVLKVMNATTSDSSDFMERFINEGRIVAALRHPNIITIFDIGKVGELVYIAMEYVEGGDLKARIESGMTPDEAVDVVMVLAGALGYAHQQGIIHRDVKPANVLFRGDGTVLLSDFGIAKQIEADSELTSTGTILGSPFYMSPEQAEGMVVDGRTDIYSLGVIYYEMLTGERPYQGDSAIKVIMQHIQSPLPTLPEEFAAHQPMLARIMAKDRDERAPDAITLVGELAEFRARLHGAAHGAAAPAAAPSTASSEPARKRSGGRDRNIVAVLALLVVLVAGGGGYYFFSQWASGPSVVRARPAEASINLQASNGVANQAALAAKDAAAAPPESGVTPKDVSKALEWLAKNSLREDRLIQPPADNAYYYYSRLLALDPTNVSAQNGFAEIAERFVVLAEEEFSRRNYGKAQAYVTLGLQVDPQNDGLNSLQAFIENRKKSFLDTVLGLFSTG